MKHTIAAVERVAQVTARKRLSVIKSTRQSSLTTVKGKLTAIYVIDECMKMEKKVQCMPKLSLPNNLSLSLAKKSKTLGTQSRW
jgi:hypothetical protein